MKKSLLGLLLAVALVVPAFATDMELVPKVGYLFSPEMTVSKNGKSISSSNESAVSLGADLFFDMGNNLFLGAGLVYGTEVKVNDASDDKFGFTNLYATLKYKALVNASEDDPFYVYPFANLGIGFPGYEVHNTGPNFTMDAGLYWAIGVGGEYKNIILEAMYGCNYSSMGSDGSEKVDFSYTAFRINVGYKFNI